MISQFANDRTGFMPTFGKLGYFILNCSSNSMCLPSFIDTLVQLTKATVPGSSIGYLAPSVGPALDDELKDDEEGLQPVALKGLYT